MGSASTWVIVLLIGLSVVAWVLSKLKECRRQRELDERQRFRRRVTRDARGEQAR